MLVHPLRPVVAAADFDGVVPRTGELQMSVGDNDGRNKQGAQAWRRSDILL
jgi:hypothetical protein